MKNIYLLALLVALLGCEDHHKKYTYIVAIDSTDTEQQIIEKAANLVPSARQWEWQQMEMTAFLHFGINTFYDQEWGHGTEDPKKFNPSNLDTDQWANTIMNAGMKMAIVTAKHHDGFCMWPSEYTEHSVKNSPWKDGKGDVVGDLAESCRKVGLKFGVYLSPWDRNAPMYGTDEYNDYFINQLTELLTNYGQVDEVWFDGANGEGPNGKRQVYDWDRYYGLIRKLQPQATIAVMGPDVRWVGTESGYGRDTEWSVIPADNLDQDKITAISQQDVGFVPVGDKTEEDLGSRKKLINGTSLVWYPSEVDVSIRPGWFYHESQDDAVKSPQKLMDIYYSSVGKNSLLLLNIPPDTRGLISKNDSISLMEMKSIIDQTFSNNLAVKANENIENLVDGDVSTYWSPQVAEEKIVIKLNDDITFNRIMLQENILSGQRVEEFTVEAKEGNKWKIIAKGTTIGYKRLLRTDRITTNAIRIGVDKTRSKPEIGEVGLYLSPPVVALNPASGIMKDSIKVEIASNDPEAVIRYTLDGTKPNGNSPIYNKPLTFFEATKLNTAAFTELGHGYISSSYYPKFKYNVEIKSEFSPKFHKRGALTLIDEELGSGSFDDGKWLGFEGNNLEADIDLGEITSINGISMRFFQRQSSWIFLPISVQIQTSPDGINFSNIYEKLNTLDKNEDDGIVDYSIEKKIKTRYIRVIAENGNCPDWHEGKDGNCWMFIDEIAIQ